jgi:hypothetical protein
MYKKGSWNVICDVCGFEFKADKIKKRWDGLMVCNEDFEHDHPQKHIRVREDNQQVAFVRADPPDQFIHVCYLWERSAYADLAAADCARADNITSTYPFLYMLKFGTVPSYTVITYTFDGWYVPQYA